MSTEKKIRELPSTDEARMMALSRRSVEDLAGTILLDRYRLIELRGEGGAAVVYKAEHSIMHKPVAVKMLRPEHSARQDYIRRFIAEARTVARLRHRHIVDILDIDRTEEGFVFCVMEYLEGEELGATLERDGPMPLGRARDFAIQVAEALAAAHAVGIVHRDVKPQNIFRITQAGDNDFVKLLDFGIAKHLDEQAGITNTGTVMGTAEYMAPEQCRAQPVDGRADVYSLGVTLFELLTGRCPFEGDGFLDVLMKHVNDRPPRLTVLVPSLPPAVDQLMERALAKRPDDRFASMEEFVEALEALDTGTQRVEVVQTDPTPIPRAHHHTSGPHQSVDQKHTAALLAAVLGGATLCALVLFGLYFLTRGDSTTQAPATAVAAEGPPRTESVEEVPSPVEAVAPAALPVDEPPLEEAAVDVEPQVTPVPEDQKPARAQPEPQVDPGQSVEPKPDPVEPKPATGPTSAEKKRLTRSIESACANAVGFQDRTATAQVRGSRAPSVKVDPPYPLLEKCIEKQLDRAPDGSYTLRLSMKPGGR